MRVEVELDELNNMKNEEFDKGYTLGITKARAKIDDLLRDAYEKGVEYGKKFQLEIQMEEQKKMKKEFEQTVSAIGDIAVTFCERLS